MSLKTTPNNGVTVVFAAPSAAPSAAKTTTPTPTTAAAETNLSFFSRAKSLSAPRRPWREFFNFAAVSLPISYDDAMTRVRRNGNYFRVNYAMVMLLVLFLSLLWHPVSIIVFIIVFIAWLYLYFARDEPVVVFNQTVDDRVVLGGLTLVTILALVWTNVGANVFWGLIVAVVLVSVHASFRSTEDLFLDAESAADGGLVSVAGSQPVRLTGYTRI